MATIRQMRSTSLALAASCALLLFNAPAHADERREQSHALWRLGVTQYDLGHFDQAIEHFERAYEVSKNYDILYNLAQAHRQKGTYKQALHYYYAYLRYRPDAKNAEQVRTLTEELKQLLKKQETAKQSAPPGTTSPKSEGNALPATTGPTQKSGWYQDRLGWTITAVGAVALGVGSGFLFSANGLDKDIRNAPTDADRRQLRQDASTRQTIGVSVALVGAAALTTGVILLIHNRTPTEPRVSVSFSDSSAIVGLHGRF